MRKKVLFLGMLLTTALMVFAVPAMAQESFTIGIPEQSEYKVSAGDEVSFSFEMNDPNAAAEDTYTVSVEDKADEGVKPFDASKIITAPKRITGEDKKVTVTIPKELTKDVLVDETHSLICSVTKNGREAVTAQTPVTVIIQAAKSDKANAGLMADDSTDAETMSDVSVAYSTHVENIGWQPFVTGGAMAGTSHRALRLEAMVINLQNQPYSGNIEYRTHIQNIGWESDWKTSGTISGTNGKSLRLEAMQVRLTGQMANYYDIYYRVHAENFGWLSWAKNGQEAGTAGFAYRLEAMQIVLVRKGGSQPSLQPMTNDDRAYIVKGEENIHTGHRIAYQTHVQNIGWQSYMPDGVTAGTSGKSYRLEAIKIKLNQPAYGGNVEYRSHIQNIGWESEWKRNGDMSGTSGRGYQLEAIQVRLTGEMANHYDVYYRVHAQNFGWMGWAKNGSEAGTEKFGYRLEAVQIVLVNKGRSLPSYSPAGNRSEAFIRKTKEVAISMAREQGYDQIHEGTLKFITTPAEARALFASEYWWKGWCAQQPDSRYYGRSPYYDNSSHLLPFPILVLDRETTVKSAWSNSRNVEAWSTKYIYFPNNKESWRPYNGKRIVIAYRSVNAKRPTGVSLPGYMPFAFDATVTWVD